jgi:metallo-beta-lactamase family protein
MGRKKETKIKITFCGNNSTQVTGSCILIETEYSNILLECGMTQSANSLEDYKINAKPFPFKAKNIDYLFLNHCHADHIGLSPKLVADGFEGKIITTPITAKLMKPMLLDSAGIIARDAENISRKRGKEIYPFYNEDDVDKTLNMTYEYGYGEIFELDTNVSFRFLHNSHIIGAAQLELFLKTSTGKIEKIFYTSDLGGFKLKNHYVDSNNICSKSSIVISESTYGERCKDYKPDRDKDLEKIKTVVNQVCIGDKGRILIPVFSLARSQQMLTDLYLLYGDDKDFNIPIVVDSPLIWELVKVYKEVLDGENLTLFENVCNWKNVRFIKDYNESKLSVLDKTPKIVLSSSGFLVKGRSVNYLKQFISNVKDHILSVGYAHLIVLLVRLKIIKSI